MKLTKGGVTFDVTHPSEIARLKAAGYREVVQEESAPTETKTPEQKNAEAITEANKPIGSKKIKGGEK